jgi:hypothetical protein
MNNQDTSKANLYGESIYELIDPNAPVVIMQPQPMPEIFINDEDILESAKNQSLLSLNKEDES